MGGGEEKPGRLVQLNKRLFSIIFRIPLTITVWRLAPAHRSFGSGSPLLAEKGTEESISNFGFSVSAFPTKQTLEQGFG